MLEILGILAGLLGFAVLIALAAMALDWAFDKAMPALDYLLGQAAKAKREKAER